MPCKPPAAQAYWHPLAKAWYRSLAKSGQSAYYELSDWSTATILAEEIHRGLTEQLVGVTKDGRTVHALRPLGSNLASILKGMASLMVTEGDRRRLQVELERTAQTPDTGSVSWIDQARRVV